MVCNTLTLDSLFVKFWKIEACDDKSLLTSEQSYCEDHFNETVHCNDAQSFVVTFPINDKLSSLGN